MVFFAGSEEAKLRLVPLRQAPEIGDVKLAPDFSRGHRLANGLEDLRRIGRFVGH
jgi:hypothetical protein